MRINSARLISSADGSQWRWEGRHRGSKQLGRQNYDSAQQVPSGQWCLPKDKRPWPQTSIGQRVYITEV